MATKKVRVFGRGLFLLLQVKESEFLNFGEFSGLSGFGEGVAYSDRFASDFSRGKLFAFAADSVNEVALAAELERGEFDFACFFGAAFQVIDLPVADGNFAFRSFENEFEYVAWCGP